MTERERQGEHGWVWQGGRSKEWVRENNPGLLLHTSRVSWGCGMKVRANNIPEGKRMGRRICQHSGLLQRKHWASTEKSNTLILKTNKQKSLTHCLMMIFLGFFINYKWSLQLFKCKFGKKAFSQRCENFTQALLRSLHNISAGLKSGL